MSCPGCGKKNTIDRNLTGYFIPEPPVAEWARELSNTRSPSRESLEEVKEEFRRRNQRKRKPSNPKRKRSINQNAKSFISLTVIAAVVAIVFPFLSSISNPQFDVNFKEGKNKFKFLERSENNAPMYFEGCGDISYEVRTNYASPIDLELIQYALDEISKVYGRKFVFKGTTDSFVTEDINSNILINFTSDKESQELKEAKLNNGSDIAGLGGPLAPKLTNKPISRSWAWTKGFILIEQNYWLSYDELQKINLVIHEIGHVLGLDHPANLTGQIMGYGDDVSVELGSGDKLGLQALSALAGCREMPEF